MRYFYTYRITNTLLKKHYYGVRTSCVEPHKDLGIHYFSSSTDDDFLSDQQLNRDNYKYKALKNEKYGIKVLYIKDLINKYSIEQYYKKIKEN